MQILYTIKVRVVVAIIAAMIVSGVAGCAQPPERASSAGTPEVSATAEGCRPREGSFTLTEADTWYVGGNGWYLSRSSAGGYVAWDPYGGEVPADPVEPDAWILLPEAPFLVCVERATGTVHGLYSGRMFLTE